MPGEPVSVERVSTGGTWYRRIDEDGVVSIEVREGRELYLLRRGDLRGLAWAGEEDAEVPVRLEAPPRVAAVLLNSRGERITPWLQWVDVTVVHVTDEGVQRRIQWGGENADDTGRADLTGDLLAVGPAGVVNVVSIRERSFRLRDGPLRITAEDLRARIDAAGGGEVVLELPLVENPGGPALPIVVVGRDGRPVAGVRIGVPGDADRQAVTDERGRAEVRLGWEPLFPWRGDWYLSDRPGAEPQRVEVEPAPNGRVELILPGRLESLPLRCDGLWLELASLPPTTGRSRSAPCLGARSRSRSAVRRR